MTIETQSSAADGFAALGIRGTLLQSARQAGLIVPKPIQKMAIPPHLAGRDILGVAQTGSGKTAAFALPILASIAALGAKRRPKSAHALILAPTRELAVQIEETVKALARGAHISTALVLGGVSRNSQVNRLRAGVDILIATPGRLIDLVRAGEVQLGETRWLVLDEADRMLDMGFIHDVRRLAKATHPARQTALFSATMPQEIEALAAGLMKDPVRVYAAPQATTAAEISQAVVRVHAKQKRSVLAELLAEPSITSAIVFTRTKHGADKVARGLLQDGFAAAVIHGNKSQNARQRALSGFRAGEVPILVATDIAARGIDVPGISHVINFDLPDEPESYVHRIGRTGRNGMEGAAITLCDPGEAAKLRAIEKVIRQTIPLRADRMADPNPGGRCTAAGETVGAGSASGERTVSRNGRGPNAASRRTADDESRLEAEQGRPKAGVRRTSRRRRKPFRARIANAA